MSPRREFLVVFLLATIAVSMVAVATITNSYVPLFVAWIPYAAIPTILSRADKLAAVSTADSSGSQSTGD